MHVLEAEVLQGWLRMLEAPPKDYAAIRAFRAITHLALFLIFMVAIGLNKHIAGWTLIGLLVVALFVGSALTIVVARRRGRERLRYVLPHLNVQSMRERLAQLEPKR